jgi:hypothetical protein
MRRKPVTTAFVAFRKIRKSVAIVHCRTNEGRIEGYCSRAEPLGGTVQ